MKFSTFIGQETRAINALSAQEVQDYLDGKGMGFAKAAELNQYPGPAHVLELAAPLNLTAEQKQRTQELFSRMQKKAANLGRMLVEEEQKLDRLFSTRTVTPDTLSAALERIGKLQGEVRLAHLEAHLTQAEILSATQISKYVQLRGYTGNPAGHDGQHHQH
jgi:Spy/CpxP family protein refolding chaperone